MLSPMTGYAATALAWLATHGGGPVQVKEIADRTGVPAAYLGKIMHQLARAGIVETRKGLGGGVLLERDADALSLYDLAEALGDPILTPRCMLGVEECSDERACPAHEFWKQHREREIAFLRRTTLRDIAEFERRRELVMEPTNARGATPEGDQP